MQVTADAVVVVAVVVVVFIVEIRCACQDALGGEALVELTRG